MAYRSVGSEVLLQMGAVHRTYDYETKLAAARAFVDGGESRAEVMSRLSIASLSSFERWCAAYRRGGAEALRPKPKGRPRGSKPAPRALTREEELEERVRRLEAENAYLKKSIALKARKRSQGRSGRR
ncbi:MAG: helix-turn-helix domain-containing protein [Parafannyhessea sp.]|uniref:helix-turn-helix domain-containing protein n=1 Tax=Parafannyhessea sp. TaxID=2847324 RepID=UPI003F07922E